MSQGESESAQRSAREQLEEERRIFFSGPVVVFKWRNAPGWPVEYASPNVEQVFGYTAREFLDGVVSYAELIAPEDLERVTGEVRAASEGGKNRFAHEPYRFYRKSGELGWLDDYTTIVRGKDGGVEHYIGYVIDATKRKLIEEESARLRAQVLHSQKLESLGVLAGGIAHDFNNLLTGIFGVADLIERAPTREAALPHLELLRKSASRAADLCRQLLAYSGRGRFQIGAYDLNKLIEEMADLLALAISKRVELRYKLTAGLPPIRADATQIRQLVMNLITNASEAIGDAGGVVKLETGRVQDFVYLRVRDNGCGMDEATRARIFDPFFSTKQEGRGLGLSAVDGILRGHGGTIEVESEPGKGTTIEVRLPISTQPATPRRSPPPFDASWRGSGTALVIDDEEIVRIFATHVLEAAGFRVRTAEDGAQGLALCRELDGDVAVVLLDLTMPGLGGIGTLRGLLELRPDLPVVLMSGFNREEVAAQLDPGVHPLFLKKPFEPRELLSAVRQALEERAAAQRR